MELENAILTVVVVLAMELQVADEQFHSRTLEGKKIPSVLVVRNIL